MRYLSDKYGENIVAIHGILRNKFDVCGGAPIYHASTPFGKCALVKTLMTNRCSFDCAYCQNSVPGRKRGGYEPLRLAKTFMNLYWNRRVKGLFLSSAIGKHPDDTTEKMLQTIRLIRFRFRFSGYIHFKILPGTSFELVRQASELADRLSINIECPTKGRLQEISSTKVFFNDLVKRQFWIRELHDNQTTQLVVGAAEESDKEILKMVDWEYRNIGPKRVYFSAFEPIKETKLENKAPESLERQNNLYKVDFLMRQYDYKLREFELILKDEMLPAEDPKILIARQTLDKPVEINDASYQELLRIPGIGPKTAQRLSENKAKITKRRQLQELGVIIKRAEPFIRLDGWQQTRLANYA